MKKEPSIREIEQGQARARAVLDRLAVIVAMFRPGGVEKHFKTHAVAQQSKGGAVEFLSSHSKRIATEIERVTEFVITVLMKMAAEEIINDKDLATITEILDRHRGPIMFHGIDGPGEPYRHGQAAVDVEMIRLLLEYMNVCARYGVMHGVCSRKECAALMTSGRGGKKYCSDECRKARWNYESQRDYYRKHRQTAREMEAKKMSAKLKKGQHEKNK